MFSAFTAAPPKRLTEQELQALVRDQILREAGVDFESRPILCVYACYLPDPLAADYDMLLNFLFQRLDDFVENDYVLVLFAAGTMHQPGWSWLYKAYTHLGRNPKFARKVQWIYNLTQLGSWVPLQQLFIPDVIRQADAKVKGGKIPLPTTPSPDAGTAQLGTKVFGAPLSTVMGDTGELGLPRVVIECITYIREHGLELEGIFRRSPSSQQLQAAKRAYNVNDEAYQLTAAGDVHLACSLLKSFFRDLPEAVFPAEMYGAISGIHACKSDGEQTQYIKSALLPILSQPTFQLLHATFSLLHQVHTCSERNLMTAQNLTIVWSPNLVRSDNPIVDFNMGAMGQQGGGAGNVIRLCIERYPEIFDPAEP
ncbi:hypothetical protein HKX48_004478 [Thoreauomyces humboldtii]|nr:hypothetical protein HKX48_004478 [Thoreauomyces humboldtii]